MSTFPYVDISHKKIWRPLSTGRYVDPTLFLFIYFVAGALPSVAQLRRFVQTGQVPRGLRRDVAPARRVWRGGGVCVCELPSLPRAPLFSPLPVTIRRTVVAGSMTPWAEAASALVAAGGCGRPPELPAGGQGRSAARAPRPAQVAGRPRVGGGVRGWIPPPSLSAAGRPTPAAASASRAHARPRSGSWRCGVRPTRGSSLLVLRRLCGFPGTWYPRLCKLALSPGRSAGGCGDGEQRKVGNQ